MPIIKPQLTALTYAIVASLVGRKPKTRSEISAAIDWTQNPQSLRKTIHRLVTAGILESEYLPLERYCLYRVTEAGEQAFRETLDYYVFLAQQGPQGRKESGKCEPMRRATDGEAKQIIEAAAEPFRAMFETMRFLDCLPIEVIRMRIEDIDLAAGIVAIGDRRAMLDLEGRKRLAQVIGQRQAGPLFPGRDGRRRGEKFMMIKFSELRNQLNLGRNVVLCGVSGVHWSRRPDKHNGQSFTSCLG